MRALIPTGNLKDMVRFADVDEPEPTAAEAVIAVEAFSINRGETFLLEAPRPGWRPGKDIAGRVVRAAADGTGPSVGTSVVGHPSSHGWAERVAVAVSQLAPLPANVDVTTAAALPLAGLTALRLLRVVGSLAGRRILITGAAGVPDAIDLATLVRLVEAGRLHPEVGSVSGWEDTSARIADLRARHIRGKAILHV